LMKILAKVEKNRYHKWLLLDTLIKLEELLLQLAGGHALLPDSTTMSTALIQILEAYILSK